MTSSNFAEMSDDARPVFLISKNSLDAAKGDDRLQSWIEQSGFSASPGELQLLPGADGLLSGALFGVGKDLSLTPLIAGALAKKLPAGDWYFDDPGEHALSCAHRIWARNLSLRPLQEKERGVGEAGLPDIGGPVRS